MTSVLKPLEARETRFADAAGAAPARPVVGLGGEDLGEISQVGLALPDRDLRHPGSVGADGR
jgi:hypothetical protein